MRPRLQFFVDISAGLLSAAAFLAALLIYGQNIDLRAQVAGLSADNERRKVEVENNFSQLSDRFDALAARTERDIDSSRTGTRGDVKRLQSHFTESFSTVQVRLNEMAGYLNRPRPDQAIEKIGGATLAASAFPTAEDPMPGAARHEQDLAFMQGMQESRDFYAAGRYGEVVRKLSPLLEKQPANPDTQLYYAASLFRANPGESANYAVIERHLKAVIKERKENVIALETLGALCMERGRWAEGLEWLSQSIVQEPEKVEVLRNAGSCALNAGALDTAQSYFDKAAALAPSEADLWYFSGSAYASAGKNAAAVERFQKCLSVQPRHVAAHLKAGLSLRDLGRIDEAIEHLSASLAARPNFEAMVALGDCYHAKGDPVAAEDRWRLSLGLIAQNSTDKERKSAGVYQKLTRSSWKRGDRVACKTYALEGLKSNSVPILQAYLGMCDMALGDEAKGVAQLQRVRDQNPNSEAASVARQALGQGSQ